MSRNAAAMCRSGLLQGHVDLGGPEIDGRLLEIEKRNLAAYGYGIKGFILSMVETAIEITGATIPAADIQAILRFGLCLAAAKRHFRHKQT